MIKHIESVIELDIDNVDYEILHDADHNRRERDFINVTAVWALLPDIHGGRTTVDVLPILEREAVTEMIEKWIREVQNGF